MGKLKQGDKILRSSLGIVFPTGPHPPIFLAYSHELKHEQSLLQNFVDIDDNTHIHTYTQTDTQQAHTHADTPLHF